jgi:hypothetical protein
MSATDQSKLEEEQVAHEKKKRMEKAQSYARQVKEMYWPKVSEVKKLELEQIKEQLKSQNVRRSAADLKTTEGGRQRLQPLKSGRGMSSNVYKNKPADISTSDYQSKEYLDTAENNLESTRTKRRLKKPVHVVEHQPAV